MQLRHIRPRSVEWYDALMEEDLRQKRRNPEEARLQGMLEELVAGARRREAEARAEGHAGLAGP